nr:hypothetical protein [Mycoplasmopsis bovis]
MTVWKLVLFNGIGRFNKDPETFRVIAIPIMYAEWRSSKSLTIFLSW